MSCKSPFYRVPVSSSNYRLLSFHDRTRVKNGGVLFFDRDFPNSFYYSLNEWQPDDVQKLPCGQCIQCRLNYSRDWAVRCSLEAQYHDFNYFVTLTYDDDHLPKGEFVDYNGEIYTSSLVKRDIQLFVKKLREWERITNNNTGIKVFYCGEYGDLNSRPHFHICLFGVSEVPDLTFSFKRGNYSHYKSSLYESFWSCKENGLSLPRGFVDITECTFDSIAYTARYVLKKQKGVMKKDFLSFYDTLDENRPSLRVQPFVGMSLRPGIASEYWHDNKESIKVEDLVKYNKHYQLFKSRPPRYFDKLFDIEDHFGYLDLKERRKRQGIEASKLKKTQYSESELSRLDREAAILQDKEDKYHVRSL